MEKTKPSSSAAIGILTVVLTLVGWSSVPLFLRHFADLIDLWTSNGWRYGFSALVWAPVLVIAAARRQLPKGLWKAALVPSIVNATGQVCFTWAHYRIEPGLLTFGLRSQLIFVAIGAWALFPRERVVIRTPGYLAGATVLLIGMTGVVVMSGADHSTGIRAAEGARSQGLTLAISSGLIFACYGLAVRKYMEGINPVIAFAAICQYTALAMVVLMICFGNEAGLTVLSLPGKQISYLLLSAVIGIAVGHVFYYISIARLGVAVTAGVLQLQPFIVAMVSMALFGEKLSAGQWMSGCVAVCGALMMLWIQWRMSQVEPLIEEPVAEAEGKSGA
ncbi:MAG: DMT family transporter [Phycisphaerales bacterium]|nr:DMT family transporter [Phycisphaerales bacterium]MCI0675930.1 DMT family transporter [Phycisphaerales bacterium]